MNRQRTIRILIPLILLVLSQLACDTGTKITIQATATPARTSPGDRIDNNIGSFVVEGARRSKTNDAMTIYEVATVTPSR